MVLAKPNAISKKQLSDNALIKLQHQRILHAPIDILWFYKPH